MSSVPKAGQKYTIQKGDTLWGIATIVYGSGRKYEIIWNSNKSNLRSGDPNLIYPGEMLWIPENPEDPRNVLEAERIPSSSETSGEIFPNAIKLEIDGQEVNTGAISVLATLDTPSDGWVATVRHNGKSDHTYELLRPYKYAPSKVTIGKTHVGNFLLYNHGFDWGPDSGTAKLDGFAPTVDFVDSVTDPPYQDSNTTFEEWINKKASPFGLAVEMDVESDDKYKRVKMDKNAQAFSHFKKLASERGYLIGNTKYGALKVFDAPEDGPVVASFSELSSRPVKSGSVNFNGRGRFRRTKGYGTGPRKNITETVVDEYVRRERMQSVSVDNSRDNNILDAVNAAKNKTLEQSLTFTIPISDFYDDNYELFWPGKFVSLQLDRVYIERPFKFLIKDVEFIQNGSKRTGNLTVVPPTVYTKGELIDPWNTELLKV